MQIDSMKSNTVVLYNSTNAKKTWHQPNLSRVDIKQTLGGVTGLYDDGAFGVQVFP